MEHTAQVMGIAGAGRGTGVTHFVIQAANYLCSCRQKKTAILQWNPQKDLEKIRAFLGAGGKEDSRSFKKKDHFRLLGVDYYYEGDPAVLAACMEKDYQEILIDFGKVREEIFPEWLRCTKKSPGRRPVRMEAGSISGIVDRERGSCKRMDLYDCIWRRDHETGDRAAVPYFLKTDPTFSRCIFSRRSDHGMVCGYI